MRLFVENSFKKKFLIKTNKNLPSSIRTYLSNHYLHNTNLMNAHYQRSKNFPGVDSWRPRFLHQATAWPSFSIFPRIF
jgi:hypothetical protein